MADLNAYPCPCCQIGYYQPGKQTYLRMHHGMLISVPDMLVWVCDICQHEEFDHDAVLQLEALLGSPETGSDGQRSNAKVQAMDMPEPPPARRVKS
jgi:hypothetical protein